MVKGIKMMIISFLLASIMMPFYVHADTISQANIIGTNISYNLETSDMKTPSAGLVTYLNVGTLEFEVVFDKPYLGNVNLKFTVQMYDLDGTNGISTFIYTYPAKVCGRSVKVHLNNYTTGIQPGMWRDVDNNNQPTSDPVRSYTTTLTGSNVIEIVDDGSLEMIQYNFPIESVGAIFYLAKYHGIDNYFSYGNYYYPYFEVSANERLLSFYASSGNHYYLIFGSNPNIYSLEYFNQCFSFVPNSSGTVTVNSCRTVKSYGFGPQYQIFNFVILDIQVSTGGTYYLDTNINMTYMPIYYGISTDQYISTDFAIEWGLSNRLLDNIQTIAQGTQQSNSAASGLESSNMTMASDMNSMATIENGYSQDFNSQLQNIDFTNPIQQNQGILPAANFVISIFNGLISNNPFAVLIIIVCILLIGKKVIGK